MVRVGVLAFLIAALACSGAAAGTITPSDDSAEDKLRSADPAHGGAYTIEDVGPAMVYGHFLLPMLEPDDPLRLLSDLKLGGDMALSMPIDPGSDNPWMTGLTPHEASTKFATLEPAGAIDSVSMAAVALVGIGLLGLSLVLWRRSVRRARRRSSRRRNGGLQTA